MRIDPSDDGDERPDAADAPEMREADAGRDARPDRDLAGKNAADHGAEVGSAERTTRALEHRASVDAVNCVYTVDQGYARVREIEEQSVTPAMRRIEAEDPARHLAGLDHRLKGQERLTEKVEKWLSAQPDLRVDDAFKLVKDAIRYTFAYRETHYTQGVWADIGRLKEQGFELHSLWNAWSDDQYKGINSQWIEPDSGQRFEVQFHTRISFEAKQLTHLANERLRTQQADAFEELVLEAFQKKVAADVPIPNGATDIPDYP